MSFSDYFDRTITRTIIPRNGRSNTVIFVNDGVLDAFNTCAQILEGRKREADQREREAREAEKELKRQEKLKAKELKVKRRRKIVKKPKGEEKERAKRYSSKKEVFLHTLVDKSLKEYISSYKLNQENIIYPSRINKRVWVKDSHLEWFKRNAKDSGLTVGSMIGIALTSKPAEIPEEVMSVSQNYISL